MLHLFLRFAKGILVLVYSPMFWLAATFLSKISDRLLLSGVFEFFLELTFLLCEILCEEGSSRPLHMPPLFFGAPESAQLDERLRRELISYFRADERVGQRLALSRPFS